MDMFYEGSTAGTALHWYRKNPSVKIPRMISAFNGFVIFSENHVSDSWVRPLGPLVWSLLYMQVLRHDVEARLSLLLKRLLFHLSAASSLRVRVHTLYMLGPHRWKVLTFPAVTWLFSSRLDMNEVHTVWCNKSESPPKITDYLIG